MPDSIAVVGPTASGKTRRAVEIAKHFGGEIISADSRQVYKGMSIGTGKDLIEYGDIPFHLIDIMPAGSKYNLHNYLRDFRAAYRDVLQRGKMPVICGGSGMYVENALKGVIMPEVPENRELRDRLKDKSLPELIEHLKTIKTLHNTTDVDTRQRAIRAIEIQTYYINHPEEAVLTKPSDAIPLNALVIGIDIPREERRNRITERLIARINEGMIDEVKTLLDSNISPEDLIYYGLEYKYVTLYLIGKLSLDSMITELETAIHQFAKRQMTWFRGMQKRATNIHWLPYDLSESDFIRQVKYLYDNYTY
ncbi:MAG: tRNA (adenosine(37)-N6)-dimethylallyltransferase MiaA [Muribaculaceae bacterium]|nr:tRNA (adenosine(37)-N6)-dimethylallyltransferase MiaA [Muribaculaceae bacterium]